VGRGPGSGEKVRTISVYHVKDQQVPGGRSLSGEISSGLLPINFPTNHELVAEVQTDKPEAEALDEVYMFTQNINEPWVEHVRVNFKKEDDGCRSTHIGDVLVMDGNPYVCEVLGWTRVKSVDQKIKRG
jgi:hypothetical protein